MSYHHHRQAFTPVGENVCQNLGAKFSAVKTRRPSEERKRAKLHILRLQHELKARDQHYKAMVEARDHEIRRQQVLLAAKDHEIHGLTRELEDANEDITSMKQQQEWNANNSRPQLNKSNQGDHSVEITQPEAAQSIVSCSNTTKGVEVQLQHPVEVNNHRCCDEGTCQKPLRGETNRFGEGDEVGIFCQSCLDTKGVMEVMCYECVTEYGEFCSGPCQTFRCYACLPFDDWLGEEEDDFRYCSHECNPRSNVVTEDRGSNKAILEEKEEKREAPEQCASNFNLGVPCGMSEEASEAQHFLQQRRARVSYEYYNGSRY